MAEQHQRPPWATGLNVKRLFIGAAITLAGDAAGLAVGLSSRSLIHPRGEANVGSILIALVVIVIVAPIAAGVAIRQSDVPIKQGAVAVATNALAATVGLLIALGSTVGLRADDIGLAVSAGLTLVVPGGAVGAVAVTLMGRRRRGFAGGTVREQPR